MPLLTIDEVTVGGYEIEEQKPEPFISLECSNKDALDRLQQWLTVQADHTSRLPDLFIQVAEETSETDLLKVTIGTGKEQVVVGNVFRDEMWRIFEECLRQQPEVLLLLSCEGEYQLDPVYRIGKSQLEILR
ncbi:hypothetical protein [Mechercharimyces sp. CAU 1602]|uniref:hypothetical protein n=1 Tax=Mechercharimyces sp. CAU 1602 TaxID=2973933 RepID=UPI0021621168|nr:hypothetical protein [Mechercharimyces sp. CAU 1602]MCS1350208.1 hypothetical protein [Mechercharimyces sp. CAU 1602]